MRNENMVIIMKNDGGVQTYQYRHNDHVAGKHRSGDLIEHDEKFEKKMADGGEGVKGFDSHRAGRGDNTK